MTSSLCSTLLRILDTKLDRNINRQRAQERKTGKVSLTMAESRDVQRMQQERPAIWQPVETRIGELVNYWHRAKACVEVQIVEELNDQVMYYDFQFSNQHVGLVIIMGSCRIRHHHGSSARYDSTTWSSSWVVVYNYCACRPRRLWFPLALLFWVAKWSTSAGGFPLLVRLPSA